MKVKEIELNEIRANPLQPRQDFDREKLQELANSIKESELLQPIVVRPNGEGYEIVAGERRFKSFQILKKESIPCIILDIKDDFEALEKSTIENLQRANLTSVEKENVIYELWKSGKYKTKGILAEKLGISQSRISALIDAKEFREKLEPGTKVSSKSIIGTRGLLEEDRKEMLKDIDEGNLSPSAVEREVKIRKLMENEPIKIKKLPFEPSDYVTELVTRISKVIDYLDTLTVKEFIVKYFSKEDKDNMIIHLGSTIKRSKEVIELLEKVDDGR